MKGRFIMSERILKREDIPTDCKWSIEDIYPSDEAWEEDFKKAEGFVTRIAGFKGQLSVSAEKLYEYFKLDDEVTVTGEALANYAMRKNDEDTRVAKYQDMAGRFESLYVRFSGAAAFVVPELLSISDDTLERFYKEKPELSVYKRSIDRVRRRREHFLSEKEEKILALSGEMMNSPENIFSMFSDADLKFPDAVDKDGKKHQLTHGSYIPLVQSADRVLRKSAFEELYHVYEGFRNTSAAVLSSQIKTLVFNARARNYANTLDAALDPNEVPTGVYHSLIEAVHDGMEYMYKYMALRKKLLGVDELHAYDIYTPIVADADAEIPFEQAKKEVYESLAPMGEEYRKIFRQGIEQRWIDVYENEGKRSGAYSAGARVHPFVLLNHKNTLDCEFTLAHEMGHAIHSYLSNKNQPVCYAEYVLFVAEVASTCNECLLMQHLLSKTTDKKRRAYLINHFLEQFRTTLYRQTMFAEFELMINRRAEEGGSLTADTLCEMYRGLNKLYYGDGVVIDKELDMEWARIPHFYYNYYVYQYATGFSAAVALSQRILKEGEAAVKDYIGFLSGGCSTDPITLLKGAGVDMTSKKPVTDALELFGSLIDEMEGLIS